VTALVPVVAAAAASALTLLVVRLRRRPPAIAPGAPTEETLPVVDWDESFNSETAHLAYEHAREMYRQADETAEVLNRKAVQVFAIASAIATVGPAIGKFPFLSIGWCFSAIACVIWLGASFECWRAFKPREYRFDPDPGIFLSRDWLQLEPGPFYLHRLESVEESVSHNMALNNVRGVAVRRALTFALVEVGFLLVALLWR